MFQLVRIGEHNALTDFDTVPLRYTATCFSFNMCNTYLAWINLEVSVPPNASSDIINSDSPKM